MPRPKRAFAAHTSYHITLRCNNREFRLTRTECRKVLLYAFRRAQEKFAFKLYALCIMSNHIHYLMEPHHPDDVPKIAHWIHWYTAMCFNRILKRTGHFWEKRYHCTGFANDDRRRALNTLRYIHGNPKAAGFQRGFFYDFSNYGSYERLTDDGLTQWHPAFLQLGRSLQECATRYRGFCEQYRPKPKPERNFHWGRRLLQGLAVARGQPQKHRGQMTLPWGEWERPSTMDAVARQFVGANALNPQVALDLLA